MLAVLMRTFTVERGNDESGISGTGIVMEGVQFSDGRVAIQWLTTPSSLVIWDCFMEFWNICVEGHPTNNTRVVWSDGHVDLQNEDSYYDGLDWIERGQGD